MAYESHRVRVAYTPGTWTDITQYVDSVIDPVRSTNGATPETTGEPASLSLVLNNTGWRFQSGPLALSSALPIQFVDTVGSDEFPLFTGFVEFPETENWVNSATKDQTIRVDAVDQLSRWERSETFVSTLAAHIAESGRGDLRFYWPLNDFGRYRDLLADQPLGRIVQSGVTYGTVLSQSESPVALADDVLGTTATTREGTSLSQIGLLLPALDPFTELAAGQTVTLVAWIRLNDIDLATSVVDVMSTVTLETPSATGAVILGYSSGLWGASVLFGNLSGSITTTRAAVNEFATPVAIRYGYAPDVFEVWIGTDRFVGSLSGSAPSATSIIDTWMMRYGFRGDIAHAQFYLGSTWGFSDYLAQVDVGLNGLERQTTGERIRTILGYAGATDLTQIDPGCSVMQRAQLAGLTVAQALYDARDTEQGDLFIDGAGLPVFHDRRRILNV